MFSTAPRETSSGSGAPRVGRLVRRSNTSIDTPPRSKKAGLATAVEDVALPASEGATHDRATFLAGESTPALFASAHVNLAVA